MGALGQTIDVAAAQDGIWERYVRPPHPGQTSPEWHVSPVIDIAAYHFSWVWVLLPMLVASALFTDPDGAVLYIYAVVMGANLAHRHFGLPYAYCDGGVFRTFEKQLTWFPSICLLLLAATPLLLKPRFDWRSGSGCGGYCFRCCGTSGTPICRSLESCGFIEPRRAAAAQSQEPRMGR